MSSNLRELHLHCSDLSFFFRDRAMNENIIHIQWLHIADWLYMAAAVDKVIIDTWRIDPSTGFCSSVDEYQGEREKLYSKLMTEFSRFNFIWGALETIIDGIVPKSILSQSRGKINAACKYLKENADSMTLIPLYTDCVNQLSSMIIEIPHYKNMKSDFNSGVKHGQASIALFVVYKVRNQFAHGSLVLPEPEEWSGIKNLDMEIINMSSRLVLMSIQMLLLCYYRRSNFNIDCCWYPHASDTVLNIQSYLRNVHISVQEKD